jgi:hypothetical protein
MRRITLLTAIIGSVLVLMVGCTNSSSSSSSHEQHKAYTPHINPAEFTTKVDNNYFPLKPATTFVYQGNKQGSIRDEMAVTHQTKNVIGVQCVVVNDKAWEGGNLIERTYDWFALR